MCRPAGEGNFQMQLNKILLVPKKFFSKPNKNLLVWTKKENQNFFSLQTHLAESFQGLNS